MTKKIVKRTDANNETLYFYTHSDAVDVGDGNNTTSLTNALNSKASASDVQALSDDVLRKSSQTLSNQEKEQVHNNLSTESFIDDRAVRYDEPQVLGSDEKAQALTNLGLNGVDEHPTKNSTNMVRSGGIAEAIDDVQYAKFDGIQETSVTLNTTTTATGNGTVLFYIPNNAFIYKAGNTYYTLWNNVNKFTNGFYNDNAATPKALTTKIFINRIDGLPYSFDGTDFTTVAIDDVPTAGSNNLVKSGGVYEEVTDLIYPELPITLLDKNGDVATDATITQSNGVYIRATDGTLGTGANLATSDFVNVSGYRGLKLRYNGNSAYSSTVAIVAFYKDDKTFISSFVQITTPGTIVEITVPINATYARFCSQANISQGGIDNFNCTVLWEQEIISNLAEIVKQTSDNVADVSEDVTELGGNVGDLSQTVSTLSGTVEDIKNELVIVKNIEVILYDNNDAQATDSTITAQDGRYLLLLNGNQGRGAAFGASNFIDVSGYKGNKLQYKGRSVYSTTVAIIAFYKQDKTYISGICQVTSLSDIVEATIPDNAYYVRVCSQKDGIDNFALSVIMKVKTIVGINTENLQQLTTETGDGSAFDKNNDKTIHFGLLNPVLETVGLSSILHDVGFIGDSLTAGEIAYKIVGNDNWKYRDKYEYSWGQRLLDRIAGKCTIYAVGGLSTRSWWNKYIVNGVDGWSVDGGNTFASHKHSAYFIALGTNDSHIPMDVGDATTDIDYSDYNQNADTFIGNYAKIIQKIREGNQRTPIFCVIYPNAVMSRMYDDAIKEMATLFSGVFIVDLYTALYNSGAVFNYYVNGGHFTTPGYQWVSWCVGCIVDGLIRNNLDYFQKQALINDTADTGDIIW